MDPNDFDWILENRLLACRYPAGAFSLASLAKLGVSELINLDGTPHSTAALETYCIREIHLPVADFTAPSATVLDQAIEAIDRALGENRTIAVHCLGGLGRTGTVLAAWLVSTGEEPAAAIARIRAIRPGSIETAQQEIAVHAYADSKAR